MTFWMRMMISVYLGKKITKRKYFEMLLVVSLFQLEVTLYIPNYCPASLFTLIYIIITEKN